MGLRLVTNQKRFRSDYVFIVSGTHFTLKNAAETKFETPPLLVQLQMTLPRRKYFNLLYHPLLLAGKINGEHLLKFILLIAFVLFFLIQLFGILVSRKTHL